MLWTCTQPRPTAVEAHDRPLTHPSTAQHRLELRRSHLTQGGGRARSTAVVCTRQAPYSSNEGTAPAGAQAVTPHSGRGARATYRRGTHTTGPLLTLRRHSTGWSSGGHTSFRAGGARDLPPRYARDGPPHPSMAQHRLELRRSHLTQGRGCAHDTSTHAHPSSIGGRLVRSGMAQPITYEQSSDGRARHLIPCKPI